MVLNKNSNSKDEFFGNRPKYATLTSSTASAIRTAIESGKFPPYSKLPSEAELGAMLGVSRTTIREALRTLEEQGLIVRRRGLGTFVTKVPVIKDLSLNFGITKMIKSAGHIPGTKFANISQKTASASMAEALGIPTSSTVLVVDRVRTEEDKPIVWSVNTIPLDLVGENALDQFQVETQSIYDYYANTLKIFITRGVAELNPVVANTIIANRLEVPRGTPIMQLSQIDYDTNGRPVLHSLDHHLIEPYKFIINRKGPY